MNIKSFLFCQSHSFLVEHIYLDRTPLESFGFCLQLHSYLPSYYLPAWKRTPRRKKYKLWMFTTADFQERASLSDDGAGNCIQDKNSITKPHGQVENISLTHNISLQSHKHSINVYCITYTLILVSKLQKYMYIYACFSKCADILMCMLSTCNTSFMTKENFFM